MRFAQGMVQFCISVKYAFVRLSNKVRENAERATAGQDQQNVYHLDRNTSVTCTISFLDFFDQRILYGRVKSIKLCSLPWNQGVSISVICHAILKIT